MVHSYESQDAVASCSVKKDEAVFPLLTDDISTEAPFCGIGTIQTGLIMAATQLITGHLSQLGNFPSKTEYSAAPTGSHTPRLVFTTRLESSGVNIFITTCLIMRTFLGKHVLLCLIFIAYFYPFQQTLFNSKKAVICD